MTVQRGLVAQRPAAVPGDLPRARERVRALLDEVMRLDAEVEGLSRRLDEFSRAYQTEAGPALAELREAERLVSRLQRIEDELAGLAAILRQARSPAGAATRARRTGPSRAVAAEPPGGPGDPDPVEEAEPEEPAAPEILPEELALKRIWRRLARILHPDLAAGDADRDRLSALMAGANAAYEAGDLAALELMAERVGAGEDPGAPDEAERLAHLERRSAALQAVAGSLRRERDRLLATDTARLQDEAEKRRAAGADLAAESRTAALAEALAARQDASVRLGALFASAGRLGRLRRTTMDRLSRRGPTGALRPFDPVSESPLVRRGAALLEARRATGAARELARRLEELAEADPPWEAALTLLAFLGEAAGTPPDSLSSAEGLTGTWGAIVEGWNAPDLARALARLPHHLTLGLRAAGRELPFGVQLSAPELGAGVRVALGREKVRAVGRRVLGALGPVTRCGHCRRDRRAVHLLRLRGPDEIHGLACPACGRILRSYLRVGASGGLEALTPLALELGAVAEVQLRLGGASLALQMLPAERAGATGAFIRGRLAELLFEPHGIPVTARHLRLRAGRRELGPRERLPSGRIAAAIVGAPLGEAEALDLLRSRVERRFRE